MSWAPISEEELWDKINCGCEQMTPEQFRVWEIIKVIPEKWSEQTYGKSGGGFWVVAIVGSAVIWFNDIEDGFNQSAYTTFGTIDEYWCNQSSLESAVQEVINQFKDGYDSAGRAGPPQSMS